MDVDTMCAGPELDVLVAEKVFGKPRHEWRFEPASRGGNFMCSKCDACYCSPPWFLTKLPKLCEGEAKPYSTDIATAWEIVEKTNLFYGNALGRNSEGWEIFEDGQESGPTIVSKIATAPLAICLAALKAVL